MTAHNPPAHRRPDHDIDVQHTERLSVSTRILVDAASCPACHVCGRSIETQTRYKCLTVREADGRVREHALCDEVCLAHERGPNQ